MRKTTEQWSSQGSDDVIDLGLMFRAMWRGRTTILAAMAVFFLLGIAYLHMVTPKYTVTMLVVPVRSDDQSKIGGRLSSLASLADISLGDERGYSNFAVYPVTIKSHAVAEKVIQHDPEVLHTLFSEQWDSEAKAWKKVEGIGASISAGINFLLGMRKEQWSPPNAQALEELIFDNIDVVPDTKRPVLTITYKNKDVDFAKKFLVILNDATNQVLREITLTNSMKYEEYVLSKLERVQRAELKQVLIDELSRQETMIMLSSSNTPFAAQLLSPPSGTLRPTSPDVLAVLMASLLSGVIAGSFLVWFGVSFISQSAYNPTIRPAATS